MLVINHLITFAGAHTTASDGLYGTLPVLTVPGATLSSRVASGLNEAINLSILNTESRKAYCDMAVALRSSAVAPLLRNIRSRIYASLGEDIFNSSKFSASLEAAYTAAYDLLPQYLNIVLSR